MSFLGCSDLHARRTPVSATIPPKLKKKISPPEIVHEKKFLLEERNLLDTIIDQACWFLNKGRRMNELIMEIFVEEDSSILWNWEFYAHVCFCFCYGYRHFFRENWKFQKFPRYKNRLTVNKIPRICYYSNLFFSKVREKKKKGKTKFIFHPSKSILQRCSNVLSFRTCVHARIERKVLIEYKSWLYKGKTVALWQR